MRSLTSRDNPYVKHLYGLTHSARDRRDAGQTVLDGAHLVKAAIDAERPVAELVVSDQGLRNGEIVIVLERCGGVAVTHLSDALFAHVSPVDTPSGVLGVMSMPPAPPPPDLSRSLVVLDGVQDPGNLGTLLRTAAAAGIGDVLLTPGCAQAWSPRVLRAGMGGHFALRIHEQLDVLDVLQHYQGEILATGVGQEAFDLYALDLSGAVAWLFGAEGKGLSEALLSFASRRVTIPMAAAVESLNVAVAAAVCLFEQRRQRSVA
ncbi:MAG: RNA methyltransferase [Rhodocyclales bacterium]|nr:RNA methyltransferase [Rhodocyclales bacterium]